MSATLPPPWMARIPDGLLTFRGPDGCQKLERWLADEGLPRPSLLDLEAEREVRKS